MVAYTYLIGWSELKKYYFGLRYKKGCKTSDLWTTYFTSSKQVKQMREFFGEPDIVEIRTTFNDVNVAREHEHKVLRRLKVLGEQKWLNNTTNKAFSNNNNAGLFSDPVKKQKWYDKMTRTVKSDAHRERQRQGTLKQFSDPLKSAFHKEKCKPVWNYIWVNDGNQNRRIENTGEIPQGWNRGRIIPASQKLKMKEARGVLPRSPETGQFCNKEKVS
jgi:hypothetical protein